MSCRVNEKSMLTLFFLSETVVVYDGYPLLSCSLDRLMLSVARYCCPPLSVVAHTVATANSDKVIELVASMI